MKTNRAKSDLVLFLFQKTSNFFSSKNTVINKTIKKERLVGNNQQSFFTTELIQHLIQ
ncbi:hypothetical protein ACFL11_00655 [Patescibacteria group bacterium]